MSVANGTSYLARRDKKEEHRCTEGIDGRDQTFRCSARYVTDSYRVEAYMVRTHLCRAAAAIGAAVVAVSLSAAAGSAGAAAYVYCNGERPEYSPGDQLYKQAPISASARLALAIRWREYLATCHRVSARRHYRG
jgi:hypothetical protein